MATICPLLTLNGQSQATVANKLTQIKQKLGTHLKDERLGGLIAFTFSVRLGVASGVRRVALPTDAAQFVYLSQPNRKACNGLYCPRAHSLQT